MILVASQKGLCGGYNVNVFKKSIEYARTTDKKLAYITIGKRARDFVLRTGQELVADFSDDFTDPVNISESRKVVRLLVDAWKK